MEWQSSQSMKLLPLMMACAIASTSLLAADKQPQPPGLPYNGKVTSVDEKGQTFTLSGKQARIMHVTEATKIRNGAAEAKFSDIQAGQDVTGQATHTEETWTAKSVLIGGSVKAAAKKAAKEAPKAAQ
jgi:ribosomal protein S1